MSRNGDKTLSPTPRLITLQGSQQVLLPLKVCRVCRVPDESGGKGCPGRDRQPTTTVSRSTAETSPSHGSHVDKVSGSL